MSSKIRFLILLLPLICCSCNYGWYIFLFGEESVESRADSLPLIEDVCPEVLPQFSTLPQTYSFMLITDPHIGAQIYDVHKDEFLELFTKLLGETEDEGKKPRFVISLGDNGDGGRAHEFRELNEMFDTMAKMAKEKGVVEKASDFKNLSVLGNHDLYNDGWENFKEIEEPFASLKKKGFLSSAYTFTDGTFTFYVLDSGSGTLGETQREIVKNAMENDSKPKIVLTHVPIYAGGNFLMTMQDTRERNILLTLFEKNNVKSLFCGHAHKEYGYNYGSWKEQVFDAFGQHRRAYLVTVDRKNESVSWTRFEF